MAKIGTCRIRKKHRLFPGIMHLIEKRVALPNHMQITFTRAI